MKISVSADMLDGIGADIAEELRKRGHDVLVHGALSDDESNDWARASEAAARDVAEGRAEQGVVCCWTGTGASIAANKVAGVRAALCTDAYTAQGARRWNDANVLALSLRTTSLPLLDEILDAWFAADVTDDEDDLASIDHVAKIR
ncbi:RpiB/LacA/LacB family sugar-phosphate isomerase [Kutzneria chonburiensis]|uniref:RpiB/LacA/LacB family sugar-phosphate isomerase n=1 Tax=Kutzneria chonburiensis TaxID=1483604 RepID=A0ABV6NA68_9PSEU|nr:RpiB/LacA/LacB family sugar-phosphate isomerase [Kutzneria chonburiensis]HTI21239.1 RpiB/LacA/LacB family sugar-phosphate isomerase [Kutzneria sp.]